jgi:hypothetical protein
MSKTGLRRQEGCVELIPAVPLENWYVELEASQSVSQSTYEQTNESGTMSACKKGSRSEREEAIRVERDRVLAVARR